MEVYMKGIITPLITPFKDKKIDKMAIDRLLLYIENMGVMGVFPASTAGCFPLLSFSQHTELLEIVSRGSKMNVFAGISRNGIDETIAMGKKAIDMGIEFVVVVTPYYIKLDQKSLYEYYSTIASRIDANIITYNIPQFTGVNLEATTLSRLMEQYSSIKGVKDSSGDIRQFYRYVRELPKNALIYQGQDDLLLPSLYMGCTGGRCMWNH
jgi:4-hydroxy-tetrahydrodipicolinate synthase/2-dehydro-3-deoxy-D-gluconate aldolase